MALSWGAQSIEKTCRHAERRLERLCEPSRSEESLKETRAEAVGVMARTSHQTASARYSQRFFTAVRSQSLLTFVQNDGVFFRFSRA